MLTNEQFTRYVTLYLDTVYRVAFNYIKSSADADDVTQNVFLKLLQERKIFESDAHVKNWLIRVTLNECKPWCAPSGGSTSLLKSIRRI